MDITVNSVGYSITTGKIPEFSKSGFSELFSEIRGRDYSEESLFDKQLKMMEKAPDMFVMLQDLVANKRVDSKTESKIRALVTSIEGTCYA